MRFLVVCVLALVYGAIAFEKPKSFLDDPALKFAVLDSNHDNKLSEKELLDGWTARFKLVFKKLDKNADGLLTLNEFDDELRRSLGRNQQAFSELLAVFDTNHDGKLGCEEIVEQFKLFFKLEFKKMDKNGDGFIQPEEFNKGLESPENNTPHFTHPREAFKFLDINHDGKLSQDELFIGWIDQFQVIFRKLDKNHDRFLTRDEFAFVDENLRRRLSRRDENLDQLFLIFDTNHDNKLGFDEIISEARLIMTVEFHKMDTNHDGSVTVDEFVHAVEVGHGQVVWGEQGQLHSGYIPPGGEKEPIGRVEEKDNTQINRPGVEEKDNTQKSRPGVVEEDPSIYKNPFHLPFTGQNPKPGLIFSLIDRNHDGKLSLYEYFAGLRPIKLGEKLEIVVNFHQADRNNDYFIDRKEFDPDL